MPSASLRSPAAMSLRFLDFFGVLFACLILNSSLLAGHPRGLLVAVVVVVFVGAWALWRWRPSPASAVLVTVVSLLLLLVGNSPLSVLALWLGLVALAVTVGERGSRLFAAVPVALTLLAHLVVGNGAPRIVSETLIMIAAALAGDALARTVVATLAAQEELADANAQLRGALARSRELALAQERERIAAGLHDGLGHRLTTIGLSIDYAARMAERDPAKAVAELARARAATTDALDAMRATVRAMKPIDLVDDDLAGTLRGVASRFSGTDLQVSVEGEALACRDEASTTLVLLFVQEALSNVVRHSEADHVLVSLRPSRVVVADNGAGGVGEPGFGIASLRDRAEALGGGVSVAPRGANGGGFCITLDLPEVAHA